LPTKTQSFVLKGTEQQDGQRRFFSQNSFNPQKCDTVDKFVRLLFKGGTVSSPVDVNAWNHRIGFLAAKKSRIDFNTGIQFNIQNFSQFIYGTTYGYKKEKNLHYQIPQLNATHVSKAR
jgi:hypothetical protein